MCHDTESSQQVNTTHTHAHTHSVCVYVCETERDKYTHKCLPCCIITLHFVEQGLLSKFFVGIFIFIHIYLLVIFVCFFVYLYLSVELLVNLTTKWTCLRLWQNILVFVILSVDFCRAFKTTLTLYLDCLPNGFYPLIILYRVKWLWAGWWSWGG